MQEIFKEFDFSVLDKSFLNQIYKIEISNLGRIKKNDKILKPTDRKGKRIVIRLSHDSKRFEIGIACMVAILFLDQEYSKYTITYNDQDYHNCSLSNLSLLYHNAYRPKDQDKIDIFNQIDYKKLQRIFYKLLFQKSIKWRSYYDKDDYYQEFLEFCYHRINKYNINRHRDVYQFCIGLFKEFFYKNMRSKISLEKKIISDPLKLDLYQDKSYNYLKQLY